MRPGRVLYWLLAGTLLGVGFAALLSIGIFLLPIGLVLVLVGALALRGREVWALPFGFGLLPAALITWTILTAGPPCPVSGLATAYGPYVPSCTGPIPATYYTLAAGYALIAAVGLVGFVIAWVRAPRRPAI